jgi:integrase
LKPSAAASPASSARRRVGRGEIEILTADQINAVLARLADHTLLPIVSMALGTGMRRGELCGLAWGAVELDKAMVRVERSLDRSFYF